MGTCALCKIDRPLKESHIIPKFVFDRIKPNSPTGYLRGGFLDVNRRMQDGDRVKMLCNDCEQRFSQTERNFADKVFKPYHESGITSFAYGPWLSYFINSVNWRTLRLDNIGFRSQKKWSHETLSVLNNAETILADFLLGKRPDIGDMENHILPMFEITHGSSQLEEPNFWFRVTAFGYTFFDLAVDGYYVYANLSGVLIFTIIRKGKKDIWNNTLVQLNDGSIKQPPIRISSPLMFHMINHLTQCSKVQISQAQKDKIIESLKAKPKAAQSKAWQIRKLDEKVRDDTVG